MNAFELSHNWFDFCFENPGTVKPVHTAMYFYIIEHCNKLGWKEKFGLPYDITKEAIGIANYKTYSNTFDDLVKWGFVKLHQKSKNQYTSTIIALVKNTKATTKATTEARTKATYKADTEATQKQRPPTVDIDKLLNYETIEPLNNETLFLLEKETKIYKFDFFKKMKELGFEEKYVDEFQIIRKSKKAVNSELALTKILSEIKKSGIDKNDCLKIICEKQWKGFEAIWLNNISEKEKSSAKKEKEPEVKIGRQTITELENNYQTILNAIDGVQR